MMGKRYIKLYEQITSWEWFRYPNTLCLFIYLLLKANYCDLEYHGRIVKRGQLVTSLPKISTDTSLSIQQTRTSMNHLISTGEITDESSPQGRVITIVNYDKYQTSTDKATDKEPKINRQINRQSTDDLTASIEYIKRIELNKKNKKTPSVFIKPTVDEVEEYCHERQNHVNPVRFVDYYDSCGWTVGKGKPMKDWRAAVRTWEKSEQTERDYEYDNSMRGLPV